MMKQKLLVSLLVVPLFVSTLIAQEQRKKPSDAPGLRIARDVVYGHAGDRALKLDIYQLAKRNNEVLPAIVWIHGGGWRNGDKSSGGRLRSFVVSGDYVGFSIGYRLSGEATWPAQIHDCKAAIRWIRASAKKYGVDPKRIGVWGSSAGGHLVSLLGTSSNIQDLAGANGSPDASSRVKCVVDFCGPADLSVFRHVRLDQLFGKPAEERQAEAKAASPANYVTKDDPPFLIVHGTNDRTVPISQAELFYSKLKKAGVDVTFVKIEGGGHGIGGPEVMKRVRAFFAKHLRGADVEVSDSPIKAAGRN